MTGKTLIEDKIERLVELLEKLKDVLFEWEKNQKLKEFLFYAAEKKAEEVVELAVSINQEVLKQRGKVSLSYYESFTQLSIFKKFSLRELDELARTAGFRNRLAHEYLDIDEFIAIRTMQKMLKIYPNYLTKIKKIISSKN